MGRKAAREAAMKLLFEKAMGGEGRNIILQEMMEEKEITHKDLEYINDILVGVDHYKEEIDQQIQDYAIGWKIGRMSKVDLTILRLALYEMMYREDIPPNVSINEAIELAKLYSNAESGSFINGILANFNRKNQLKTKVEDE